MCAEKRRMPAAMKAKFLEGVKEDNESATEKENWALRGELEPRPARLGLGADPKSAHKKKETTNADRQLINKIKSQSSSSSDDEGVRGKIRHVT